jgi:hypothetical protein
MFKDREVVMGLDFSGACHKRTRRQRRSSRPLVTF